MQYIINQQIYKLAASNVGFAFHFLAKDCGMMVMEDEGFQTEQLYDLFRLHCILLAPCPWMDETKNAPTGLYATTVMKATHEQL